MEKLVLELENLNCPNCAKKIQDKVAMIEGVNQAELDFMNKKLKIEAQEKAAPNLLQQVRRLVAALEPDVVITLKQEEGVDVPSSSALPHRGASQKRQLIRIIMGAAIFVAAIFTPESSIVKIALFIISYLTIGEKVIFQAIKNVFHGQIFDENLLMTIATAGAFLIGEYPEGVAVMLFYQVGEFFQSYAVNRSRKSIAELMDIKPEFAHVKKEGQIATVSPWKVVVGDMIMVKPGEKVPLDGIVKEGRTTVDTSALTGESLPRDIKEGDSILSGCINKTGVITIEVTREFSRSTVMKILDMVENASEKKAKTTNFITKFARIYTPIVIFVAAALAFLPPLMIPGAVRADWIYRGLVFLVISCPCALVISIPLSFFAGIGIASKQGILIKGSNYLEALARAYIAVFDKTGTLTKGNFEVDEVVPLVGDRDQLLEYAALSQFFSNHPVSQAIKRAYGKDIDIKRIQEARELAGIGVVAAVDGERLLLGNAALMEQEGITCIPAHSANTAVYIAKGGTCLGYLTLTDEIKNDAKEAVTGLKKSKIKRIVMLTGDKKNTAEAVGEKLDIKEVWGELLPQEKVSKIEKLLIEKPKGRTLLFVGDGINDAPALTRADIGISMGMIGSDAATDAADVVIMTDEPSKIVTAIHIGRKTLSIVKQNIVFILFVKFAVLLLGAVGVASMWSAVFADVGVSLLSVLNSMRIFLYKKG
jgi:Cd2+/Zn2+-exporting ATPase